MRIRIVSVVASLFLAAAVGASAASAVSVAGSSWSHPMVVAAGSSWS